METRARNLPAEERRAVTVEAVIALAGAQNPSEITTAAIAKHMNLTQGALFRHFPTKDAIWQSVMEWVAERLLARIDRAAQGIDSPIAAMQAMFMSHIEFVVEHPGVPRMMFGELQRAERYSRPNAWRRHLIQRYAERIRARIEQGKASGEITSRWIPRPPPPCSSEPSRAWSCSPCCPETCSACAPTRPVFSPSIDAA